MINKKVISIVLNNFKNDSRVLKENISLQNAGYDVKVVALHEKFLKEFEKVQNIEVHRVKLKSRNWSKHKLVQFIKYFEFIYKVVKEYRDSDILHCNDLEALPIGVIIKKFFNKDAKIVYDAHEYEIERDGLKGIQKKLTEMLESFLIKYVDKTITVSENIANEYVRIYGIDKPALVLNTPNYYIANEKNIFREVFSIKNNEKIFLFQGMLGKGIGIEIILETFKHLATEHVIVFMGYGVYEQEIIEASKEYDNIYFHPAVPFSVLLDYTSSADFGVHMSQESCLSYYYALPNKIFEYLMAGLPILLRDLPDMGNLVKDSKVGILINENTSYGLKNAIDEIIKTDQKELKINIKKANKIYNWEEQEKVLLKVYNEL